MQCRALGCCLRASVSRAPLPASAPPVTTPPNAQNQDPLERYEVKFESSVQGMSYGAGLRRHSVHDAPPCDAFPGITLVLRTGDGPRPASQNAGIAPIGLETLLLGIGRGGVPGAAGLTLFPVACPTHRHHGNEPGGRVRGYRAVIARRGLAIARSRSVRCPRAASSAPSTVLQISSTAGSETMLS